MFEKRPVIENKLLSGRQFLASEPAPSDTSDSDSKLLHRLSSCVTSDKTSNNLFLVSRETESTSGSDNDQLPKCIRREVAKLSDKWSALLTQLDLWQRRLDDTLPVGI